MIVKRVDKRNNRKELVYLVIYHKGECVNIRNSDHMQI